MLQNKQYNRRKEKPSETLTGRFRGLSVCIQLIKHDVWTDYEEAKAYFLELMMTAEGEERDRAECIYIQLTHGLLECSDEDE